MPLPTAAVLSSSGAAASCGSSWSAARVSRSSACLYESGVALAGCRDRGDGSRCPPPPGGRSAAAGSGRGAGWSAPSLDRDELAQRLLGRGLLRDAGREDGGGLALARLRGLDGRLDRVHEDRHGLGDGPELRAGGLGDERLGASAGAVSAGAGCGPAESRGSGRRGERLAGSADSRRRPGPAGVRDLGGVRDGGCRLGDGRARDGCLRLGAEVRRSGVLPGCSTCARFGSGTASGACACCGSSAGCATRTAGSPSCWAGCSASEGCGAGSGGTTAEAPSAGAATVSVGWAIGASGLGGSATSTASGAVGTGRPPASAGASAGRGPRGPERPPGSARPPGLGNLGSRAASGAEGSATCTGASGTAAATTWTASGAGAPGTARLRGRGTRDRLDFSGGCLGKLRALGLSGPREAVRPRERTPQEAARLRARTASGSCAAAANGSLRNGALGAGPTSASGARKPGRLQRRRREPERLGAGPSGSGPTTSTAGASGPARLRPQGLDSLTGGQVRPEPGRARRPGRPPVRRRLRRPVRRPVGLDRSLRDLGGRLVRRPRPSCGPAADLGVRRLRQAPAGLRGRPGQHRLRHAHRLSGRDNRFGSRASALTGAGAWAASSGVGCGTSRYSGPAGVWPGWRTGAPTAPRSARERTGLAEASGMGGPRCRGRRGSDRRNRRGGADRPGRRTALRSTEPLSRPDDLVRVRLRARSRRAVPERAGPPRCPRRPGSPAAAAGLRPRRCSRRGRCTHRAPRRRPAAPPCLRSPAVPRPGPGRCRSCVPLAHRLVLLRPAHPGTAHRPPPQ